MRIISRLDIKSPNLVKGVRLEGLRIIGDPALKAEKYYLEGVDEIFYQDIVASLYQRNSIHDLIQKTAKNIFVPLTVGGGIRSLDDIYHALRSGADKVSINTIAIESPKFIAEAAKAYGSQCIVVAVESILQPDGVWRAFTNNGREKTGLNVVEWVKKAVDYGAGEIVLTSVDREGTAKGFDLRLIEKVAGTIKVPLIIHGGAGKIEDLIEVAQMNIQGVMLAHVLHYNKLSIIEIKSALRKKGLNIRPL